ncbi:caspase-3 [Trichonephila inaurata madagascariensis]|uniref:Caspase-3 n=1 Tax=Trichonephila inaurata madagascariensis TaxID=2747483 RepID=A0A8X6XG11_9ARAC|nr:caspase-3 [Trichonephila inaurata madagascariensis]
MIVRSATNKPMTSAQNIANELLSSCNVSVSSQTVRNVLHSAGLKARTPRKKPYISEVNSKNDLYETVDTRFFDNRRKQHSLGALSMQNPSLDYQSYEIPSSENVNFLSILNTNGDMGNDLKSFASKLWSVVSEKNYQRNEEKILKEIDLHNYLMTFAGQEIANTKCFICFVAGCAKGDYLYDSHNKKFHKRDVVEQFVGKKCPSLVGKPKIFIFLLFPQRKPKKFSLIPCLSADSGGLASRNFIPVHADILEVTITVKGKNRNLNFMKALKMSF